MKIHLICVYDFARRPLKRLKFNLPRKGDAQEVAAGRRVNSQHFATATCNLRLKAQIIRLKIAGSPASSPASASASAPAATAAAAASGI